MRIARGYLRFGRSQPNKPTANHDYPVLFATARHSVCQLALSPTIAILDPPVNNRAAYAPAPGGLTAVALTRTGTASGLREVMSGSAPQPSRWLLQRLSLTTTASSKPDYSISPRKRKVGASVPVCQAIHFILDGWCNAS